MFRRSEPRSFSIPSAIVLLADGERACEVMDTSERGARLRLGEQGLPDSFEVKLKGQNVSRVAQVRWRSGPDLGIQFVTRSGGDVVPDIHLGSIDGLRRTVNIRPLLATGRTVLVGVVGAFAPERFHVHLTEVQNRAPDLHRLGFARLLCVAPNDPWTVKAWASSLDPEGRLSFLCDGNLELARWLGTTFATSRRRHLGPRSRSYLALVQGGQIERVILANLSGLVFNERLESEPGDGERS